MHPATISFCLSAAFAQAALLMGCKDVGDRFFLRGVDECAGVDDDDVGIRRIGHDLHSGLVQMADHDLAIDEILDATKRDQTDRDHWRTIKARVIQ